MFFSNKKAALENRELLEKMEQKLDLLEKEIQAVREIWEAWLQGNGQEIRQELKQELGQEMQQLGNTIKKHDLAIENLLDELEEQQGDNQEKKKKEQEQKLEREKFLNLFEAYQDQFWQIKEFPGNRNETWQQQLSLMEQELKKSQIYCGITSIDQVDETVDFDLHEVIEVIDTHDENRDRKIARIYSPGFVYCGKVRKKAKAAVYRFAPDNKGCQ